MEGSFWVLILLEARPPPVIENHMLGGVASPTQQQPLGQRWLHRSQRTKPLGGFGG